MNHRRTTPPRKAHSHGPLVIPLMDSRISSPPPSPRPKLPAARAAYIPVLFETDDGFLAAMVDVVVVGFGVGLLVARLRRRGLENNIAIVPFFV